MEVRPDVEDESGVAGVAGVSDTSIVRIGVCTKDAGSVACPQEAITSTARVAVTEETGNRMRLILIERSIMLMNSTTIFG